MSSLFSFFLPTPILCTRFSWCFYFKKTTEGRLLCLFLSVYSLGILGYITATLASFFVGRDAENETAEVAGAHAIEGLRAELQALHADVLQRMKEG